MSTGMREPVGPDSRILQLPLLAPDLVEAILDGKTDPGLTLAALTSMPVSWDEQRKAIGASCPSCH